MPWPPQNVALVHAPNDDLEQSRQIHQINLSSDLYETHLP
ncbi:Hypothetical protein FNO222_0379 [Francisella orientalis]|uniref:Uncharacterized protein n=1 Tax=Francisella orientalis TaxID=299583 RepID=A0ABM5U4N8_9GAMM|nr:hypothetical protein FNO12_0377 [Francisella orientalis FNO12]AKN86680.1 Hypothetical protein FNO24_0377 [Francisella orientalis FNO24]AKN88219.1 Hypothetical protein FNO190_0377 [Francisella orientalis]AKU04973.1 Hypothetical protein FNO01_0377 [Francisella orientalis]QEN19882.1 Hypothetical protein FNO39_0379 [Francisella orientalis]